MAEPTYEQLQKQVKLLELSNHALSYVLAAQKKLAKARLTRMRVLKAQLASSKAKIANLHNEPDGW